MQPKPTSRRYLGYTMTNSKTVECFLLCLSLLVVGLGPLEAQLYANDKPQAALAVDVVDGSLDGADIVAEIPFQTGGFILGKFKKTALFVIVLVLAHAAGAGLIAIRLRRRKKRQ